MPTSVSCDLAAHHAAERAGKSVGCADWGHCPLGGAGKVGDDESVQLERKEPTSASPYTPWSFSVSQPSQRTSRRTFAPRAAGFAPSRRATSVSPIGATANSSTNMTQQHRRSTPGRSPAHSASHADSRRSTGTPRCDSSMPPVPAGGAKAERDLWSVGGTGQHLLGDERFHAPTRNDKRQAVGNR